MGIFKEFRQFAVKGNVMDLAIGVVIGMAFAKITTSLVTDIIMPPMGILVDEIDFSELSLTIKEATEATEAVTINYGNLLGVSLEFLIIAFSIFIIVRQLNKLKRKEEKKTTPPSEEILLLREIRDSLKSKEEAKKEEKIKNK